MDVPLREADAILYGLRTPTPGAMTSTKGTVLENVARASASVLAPTVSTDGSLAGLCSVRVLVVVACSNHHHDARFDGVCNSTVQRC
jgi:hypothetical protein